MKITIKDDGPALMADKMSSRHRRHHLHLSGSFLGESGFAGPLSFLPLLIPEENIWE